MSERIFDSNSLRTLWAATSSTEKMISTYLRLFFILSCFSPAIWRRPEDKREEITALLLRRERPVSDAAELSEILPRDNRRDIMDLP